jgi:hypothetical protein
MVFLPQMAIYEQRMRHYDGPDMTDIVEPTLKENSYDESTFYCCEGRPMMWMENGKSKLLPKTRETSIMVSGFCCVTGALQMGPISPSNCSKLGKIGKNGILMRI